MHLSYFVHQKSYEKIEYMLRRHWITFIPVIFNFLIMALVPVAVYFVIQKLFPDLLGGPISYPLTVLFGSVYALFTLLFFYAQFIDFYLDLWVVTNDRIIDIEQKGLFSRQITELELFQIQDVTSHVQGFFPTIFHYGEVMVTTSSSTQTIIFHQVPHPDHIRKELIRLAEGDRKFHSADTAKTVTEHAT